MAYNLKQVLNPELKIGISNGHCAVFSKPGEMVPALLQ